MPLGQVPAPRSHEELRHGRFEPVGLALRRVEREPAADSLVECRLAADDVRPRRRERVLEVGHEAAGAGVERVDDHLRLGRAGDLDPAVEQVRRRLRDAPGRVKAHGGRLGQEPERGPAVDLGLALRSALEERDADRVERPMEVCQEFERCRGQDRIDASDPRAGDGDA
jgi:hypothetical protein